MLVTDWGIVTFSNDLQFWNAKLSNGRHWVRDCDALQRLAILEGRLSNGRHWLRDCDALQRLAILKGKLSNGRHWLRDCDALQRLAILKGKLSNGRHWLRDCDACERLAIFKGKLPNGRHRLWDGDAFQRTATHKGTVPNDFHRLGYCHLDHLIAICKGSSRNFRERGRDVDLEEAFCIDCLFCCGFNFISGVNDSHLRFGVQQPSGLQCLITFY